MIDGDNEILSALVDGELKGEKLDYALALIANDGEARAQFERYQLAHDVLHNKLTVHHHVDLTAKVAAALVDVPMPTSNTTDSTKSGKMMMAFRNHLWKYAAGVAMFASVATLVVMMQYQGNGVSHVSPVAVNNELISTVAVNKANQHLASANANHATLDSYIVDHNAHDHMLALFAYMQPVSLAKLAYMQPVSLAE